MSQLYTPFRYDFVGSFLRPEYLKKARADYEAGTGYCRKPHGNDD